MKTIVMKFGGASVASPASFHKVANIIVKRYQQCKRIVVVVSAMGKMTDRLIALAKKVHDDPPRREHDMLVSVGERISMSLLAMALSAKGIVATSYTGSQSGIITSIEHSNAKIIDVRPCRLEADLKDEKIVIVAGFQGVSECKEITTLGRGGSDTTAVALGVALSADRVEFYKDVEGVYLTDPKKDASAKSIFDISYDQLLEILKNNSHQVLHSRAVILAKQNGLPLHVSSFNKSSAGTCIFDSSIISKDKTYETCERARLQKT